VLGERVQNGELGAARRAEPGKRGLYGAIGGDKKVLRRQPAGTGC
jgi:hypothetical protein